MTASHTARFDLQGGGVTVDLSWLEGTVVGDGDEASYLV